MNLPTAIPPENHNGNGQFGSGNTAANGAARGIKNQLTALRNCIFDELLRRVDDDGTNRLQQAMKQVKADTLITLAARLVPKSVEISIDVDVAPLPIVLDSFPVVDEVKQIETKKPAIVQDHNGRKKLLGLQAVELN